MALDNGLLVRKLYVTGDIAVIQLALQETRLGPPNLPFGTRTSSGAA
jgi:hypothetical protein